MVAEELRLPDAEVDLTSPPQPKSTFARDNVQAMGLSMDRGHNGIRQHQRELIARIDAGRWAEGYGNAPELLHKGRFDEMFFLNLPGIGGAPADFRDPPAHAVAMVNQTSSPDGVAVAVGDLPPTTAHAT